MAPVVRSDNQQARANSEAKEFEEWYAKANPVQVEPGPDSNHHPYVFLGTKKQRQSVPPGDPW